MSTIKLVGGAQSTWASLMTSELNSLGIGNAILGSTAINNASNLDLEIEFSVTSGGSITPAGASPFSSIVLAPLNGDGTTYGDGRFSSAAAGPPPSNYLAAYAQAVATAGTYVGTYGLPGTGSRLLLPQGQFKPIFYNGLGVALSASGNIVYYRTTNRSVA